MASISNSYYKNKMKKRFATGGDLEDEALGAGMLASGIDALAPANSFGRQATGAMAASGALKGAASGAGLGPMGMAAGALIGGVSGLFGGFGAKSRENQLYAQQQQQQRQRDQAASSARLMANPNLTTGSMSAQYFADGGQLPGPGDPPVRKRNPVGYSGIVNDKGINMNPTSDQWILNMAEYMKHNSPDSNIYREKWEHQSIDVPKVQPDAVQFAAVGGQLASGYRNTPAVGGTVVPMSSDGAEVQGQSHAEGGVQLPGKNAEVEGGETMKDDYVYSSQLGFAQAHKPLMKAKGIIEQKAATPERINALRLIEEKENTLAMAQEYFKKKHGIR